MQILERVRHYKIYRKIITTYVLLVTITIALVCSVLFALFSSGAVREIDANSSRMLSQTSYAADVLYNQSLNIANQLAIDNNVISFLYSDDGDKISEYNVHILLTKIRNVYPFIKYIEIYNLQKDNYFSTLDAPLHQMEGFKRDTLLLLDNNRKTDMAFVPRKLEIAYSRSPHSLSTLSFIHFTDYLLSTDNAIIINVDEKYIQSTIRSLGASSPDFNTFVMDPEGTILSHTYSSRFMENHAGESYVGEILESGTPQGSFFREIDGRKQLVTFTKSSNTGWYFVSLKPYGLLVGSIIRLRNLTLLLALTLVVIGILISALLTGSLHAPIKALLEKIKSGVSEDIANVGQYDEYKLLSAAFSASEAVYSSMRASVHKSARLIKDKYLMNLLKGNLDTVIAPGEILEEIRLQLESPVYRVFVFKLDRYSRLKRSSSGEEQALLRFAACNIAQELLERHCRNECLITEEDELVLLGQFQDADFQDEIILTLEEIQEAVKKYYGYTVSIGIGDAVHSIGDISVSYRSAREYVKYRLFHGHECIINAERARELGGRISRYPREVERKLTEAVRLGSQAQIQKACGRFINRISQAAYYQAVNYSNQLLLSIFKHFEGDMLHEDYKDYFDAANQINNSETISEICEIIGRYCLRLSTALDAKNNALNVQKHKRLVDGVKEYVLANYSNPALSLEAAADVVKLSPGYLGKVFKSVARISFNDYLSSVRIEKAKQLLTTTGEPASRICEKVGVFNVTYFSTLFKKTQGMTPSQYRERANLKGRSLAPAPTPKS